MNTMAMPGVWVLIMGVTGSGKSTIANQVASILKLPFIEADEFHPASNIQKMKKGIPLTDEDRLPWLQTLNQKLIECKNGAVLACSALKHSYRDILKKELKGPFHTVFLDGSYDVIAERMKKRAGHFMPPALLTSQFEALEKPADGQIISIDLSPEEIVSNIVKEVTVLRYGK
jgi:carbohydrate kinase (thermoresistant glucokinase family)